MDLINREKALACFDGWYNPIRDEWHDVEEIPGYEKLEELPIVAEVEDCISRQDAIDALDRIGSLDTEADKKYARSVFEALPSAQPEQRWIPTSERLPEPDVDVLLQLSDMMATGYYFYDGWHVYFSTERKDVIAWCKLPEPYEGRQDENISEGAL